jgi:hypothetical protein
MPEQFGKILVIVGGVLVVSGLLFMLISRLVNLNDLPGTIKIEGGSFKLVIPILASILLSIILTVVLNIVIRLINR